MIETLLVAVVVIVVVVPLIARVVVVDVEVVLSGARRTLTPLVDGWASQHHKQDLLLVSRAFLDLDPST